jgi:hypothetical protein
MLKIIYERTVVIDTELHACSVDRQNRVNWTELMRILMEMVSTGAKECCSASCTGIRVLMYDRTKETEA